MMDHVRRKAKEIDRARNFEFKDEDIDRVCSLSLECCLYLSKRILHVAFCHLATEQIIKEKQKFRKNPRNYAMTKSRWMRDKVYLNPLPTNDAYMRHELP